jgi:cytochrome c
MTGVTAVTAAAMFFALSMLAIEPAAAQDAAKGETVFNKCKVCHRVGDGARNNVDPVLNNVFGRQAGTVEGFAYSPLNKAAGESGLKWDEELVFAYLQDPNVFLKKFLTDKGKAEQATGQTKMVFKLASEQERRDVVAYLKQFTK